MTHNEQLHFLHNALQRGLRIPTPVIVDKEVQFELDGVVYIVSIRKAPKKKKVQA